MSLSTLMDMLIAGYSFTKAINEMIRLAGTTAIALILILGLVFFLPIIIASARKIEHRTLVCIANITVIVTLFLKFYIPIILWLIIMIIALSDKHEKQKKNEIPTINIIKYNEEEE